MARIISSAKRSIKKVAYFHHGEGFGGAEVNTILIAKYLDKDRYQPTIILPGYYYNLPTTKRFRQKAQSENIPLLPSPDTGNRGAKHSFREINNTRSFLIKNKFDIVHIQCTLPTAMRKTTLAAASLKIPVFRTEHQPPSVFVKKPDKYITKFFDLFTKRIIVDSKGNLDEQIRFLSRNQSKLYCSFTGIETNKFDPCHDVSEAKLNLNLDPNIPVIGTVGRLHKQKGQIYLIEAVRRVLDVYGVINLLIVGDGPLENELKQKVKELGFKEHVHFAGFQENYIPYIKAMDIAVMPSLWEGFSLSMLEFMAMGKPFIVTDHSSFREAITDGKTGLIIPAQNSELLSEAIIRLLKDKSFARNLGARAAEHVRENFSIERLTEDMMNLYDLCEL